MRSGYIVHSPEKDAEFIRLWKLSGLGLNAIAERLGIARATAGDWRIRLGLPAKWSPSDPDEKDRIIALWREGKTAAEIARELGNSKTRNAIIGIVYRAGLSGKDRAAATRKVMNTPRPAKVPKPRKSASDSPWAKTGDPSRAKAERQAATIAGKILLANATDDAGPDAVPLINRRTFGQCAWPVGDATGAAQLCCGKRIPSGAAGVRQSYCEGHGMRAVSKTFTREPAVRQDRTVAAAPRRTPESDGLWDMAA
jgi:GcrA cell cycle regulator